MLHFGIILLGKNMPQKKCGFIQSFSQRLHEHTASTTTLSESLVWVIENIISDKHD